MTRNYSSTAVATTLSVGCTSAATSVAVTSTAGFPAAPFILALDAGAAAQELVLVTGVSGLNLTVTRGYDSTSAQAHSTGAVVQHVHAGIDFREARQHEAATTGAHGTTGAVVGTTDTQTLTNKDLSSSTNTLPATVLTTTGTQTVTNKNLTSPTNTFPATLALDADLDAHAGAAAAHGATGAVVGTTNAQTLSNKSVSLGTNTVTGTKAQFDAACTDGNFMYQGDVTAPGAWTAYTPTLTNFTGTVAYARYEQYGKTVRVQVKVDVTGTSGSTITVSLPVAARTGHPISTWDAPIGTAVCDGGAGSRLLGAVLCLGSSVQFASPDKTSAGNELLLWNVASSVPISWGPGDTIAFNCEYEVN